MKLKKFEINRRSMLKGTGVALALPMLEIMMPSIAKSQNQSKPFIINMVWPDGLPSFYKDSEKGRHYRDANDPSKGIKDYNPYYIMEHFRNKATGAVKEASGMVANSRHNWTTGGFGGHYGNSVGIFTGGIDTRKYKSWNQFKASGSNGDDFLMETYDQRIARHYGLKSINAILAHGAGSINTFANRRTIESISWYKHSDGKTVRPVHLDNQPRELFNRLIGGEVMTDAASIAARRRILMNKDTVLSAVLGDINKLRSQLGMEDKARLDDYLTGVRELDDKTSRDISSLGDADSAPPQKCGVGFPTPKEDYPFHGGSYTTTYFEKMRIFQDLMTLSMECGTHHVHGLSLAGSGSGLFLKSPNSVPSGMPGHYHSWHAMSHWQFAGGGLEAFSNVSASEAERHKRYQRETYAEYAMQAVDWFLEWMQRLDQKKRPDGTSLFDNTFAAITSYIGDGNSHHRYGVPTFMAGTAGGRIPKHNGHNFSNGVISGTYQGNIWRSVHEALGINDPNFNKGSGIAGGNNGTLKDFDKTHNS